MTQRAQALMERLQQAKGGRTLRLASQLQTVSVETVPKDFVRIPWVASLPSAVRQAVTQPECPHQVVVDGSSASLDAAGRLALAAATHRLLWLFPPDRDPSPQSTRAWIAVIDPAGVVRAPGMATLGLPLERILVFRPPSDESVPWMGRLLRSRAFCSVLWLDLAPAAGNSHTSERSPAAWWPRLLHAARGTETHWMWIRSESRSPIGSGGGTLIRARSSAHDVSAHGAPVATEVELQLHVNGMETTHLWRIPELGLDRVWTSCPSARVADRQDVRCLVPTSSGG